MTNKSIAITVACLLFLGLLGWLIYGTVAYYQNEYDSEQSYNDGYAAGVVDKAKLQNEINNLTSDKAMLTAQIDTLTDKVAENESIINQYKADLLQLENDKTALEAENEQNELEITRLTTLKNEIQAELNNALADNSASQDTISSLQSQLATVNAQIISLTNTNSQNVATIASLNSQIVSLNSSIIELTADLLDLTNELTTANTNLTKLNNTISKYEQFLVGLETETQAVVTFEFDHELYNIQLVTIGNSPVINDPISTDYVVYNGWLLNNESVVVSTYVVTGNVKFVADVTYRYDVVFNDGTSNVNSQIVTSGEYAEEPSAPTKAGYTFGGWSLDGVTPVSVATTPITSNTTFIALWTVNAFAVDFVDGDSTLYTQTISYGNSPAEPVTPTKTGYTFAGWSLDGETPVTVSEIEITSATTFYALWTINSYTVTFDDGTTTSTQQITYNDYAVEPEQPTKTGYTFGGWSLDGITPVAVTTTPITDNTTFTAIWEQITYTVTYYDSNKTTVLDTDTVAYGECTSTSVTPTMADRKFIGWSIDGVNVVSDYDTTEVYSSQSYYAVYGHVLTGLYYNADNLEYLGIAPNGFVISYKLVDGEITNTTSYLPIDYACGSSFALQDSISNYPAVVSGTDITVTIMDRSSVYSYVGDFTDCSYIAADTYHTEGTQIIGGAYSYDYVFYDDMTYYNTDKEQTIKYVIFNGKFYYEGDSLGTPTVSSSILTLTDTGFKLGNYTFTKV